MVFAIPSSVFCMTSLKNCIKCLYVSFKIYQFVLVTFSGTEPWTLGRAEDVSKKKAFFQVGRLQLAVGAAIAIGAGGAYLMLESNYLLTALHWNV